MSWCGSTRSPGRGSRGCRRPTRPRRPRVAPLVLQRPQVRAVVDAVRRDRVAVAVPREEHRVAARDLAEQQRRRRLAVGRADDLAVRDGEGRQPGEAAAADDCEHGTCLMSRIEVPASGADGAGDAHAARGRDSAVARWKAPAIHDIIMESTFVRAAARCRLSTAPRDRRACVAAKGHHVPRPTVQADGGEAGLRPVHLLRRADQHQGQRRRAAGVHAADGRRDRPPHRLRADDQGAGARVRERRWR